MRVRIGCTLCLPPGCGSVAVTKNASNNQFRDKLLTGQLGVIQVSGIWMENVTKCPTSNLLQKSSHTEAAKRLIRNLKPKVLNN